MRRLRAPRSSDEGFTLIESLVACLVLMILSSAIFGVLVTALRTTKTDTARVGASQLGARELEIWRQQFTIGDDTMRSTIEGTGTHTLAVHDVDGSQLPAGSSIVVGGVPYTVSVVVTPLVTGVGSSACDGGDLVAHPEYQMTSTVTWPNMGVTAPVTNTTVLTPPKSTSSDPQYGFLAVKVTNAAGAPNSGRQIAISGPAGTGTITTDSSGCAVAQLSAAGSYTATLNDSGYVDFSGHTTSSLSTAVSLGNLTVLKMTYDRAGEIDVKYTQPAGYVLPQPLPQIALANTGIQPAGVEDQPATAQTTNIEGLWPFSTGYAVWAGSCADADPAAAPTNGSRAPATVVAPGAIATVTVALAPVDIVVTDSDGDPVNNVQVTATKPTGSSTGCLADGTLTLGTTDSSGHLGALLPNGSWQVAGGNGTTSLAVTGVPASITLTTS